MKINELYNKTRLFILNTRVKLVKDIHDKNKTLLPKYSRTDKPQKLPAILGHRDSFIHFRLFSRLIYQIISLKHPKFSLVPRIVMLPQRDCTEVESSSFAFQIVGTNRGISTLLTPGTRTNASCKARKNENVRRKFGIALTKWNFCCGQPRTSSTSLDHICLFAGELCIEITSFSVSLIATALHNTPLR